MIRLLSSLNHNGDIIPSGKVLGLGDMEEKLISSGAAERYTPSQEQEKVEDASMKDFKRLLDAYDKSQSKIVELQIELNEANLTIDDLRNQLENKLTDGVPEIPKLADGGLGELFTPPLAATGDKKTPEVVTPDVIDNTPAASKKVGR